MVTVSLRDAAKEDADRIYAWRNSPETRGYIFDPSPISPEEHQRWFSNSLERSDRKLLIGEVEAEPVGVLRYDLNGDVAEVSVYLVPGASGKGLGTALLQAGNEWVRGNIGGVHTIHARILGENAASLRAFEKAGFREGYRMYRLEV